MRFFCAWPSALRLPIHRHRVHSRGFGLDALCLKPPRIGFLPRALCHGARNAFCVCTAAQRLPIRPLRISLDALRLGPLLHIGSLLRVLCHGTSFAFFVPEAAVAHRVSSPRPVPRREKRFLRLHSHPAPPIRPLRIGLDALRLKPPPRLGFLLRALCHDTSFAPGRPPSASPSTDASVPRRYASASTAASIIASTRSGSALTPCAFSHRCT